MSKVEKNSPSARASSEETKKAAEERTDTRMRPGLIVGVHGMPTIVVQIMKNGEVVSITPDGGLISQAPGELDPLPPMGSIFDVAADAIFGVFEKCSDTAPYAAPLMTEPEPAKPTFRVGQIVHDKGNDFIGELVHIGRDGYLSVESFDGSGTWSNRARDFEILRDSTGGQCPPPALQDGILRAALVEVLGEEPSESVFDLIARLRAVVEEKDEYEGLVNNWNEMVEKAVNFLPRGDGSRESIYSQVLRGLKDGATARGGRDDTNAGVKAECETAPPLPPREVTTASAKGDDGNFHVGDWVRATDSQEEGQIVHVTRMGWITMETMHGTSFSNPRSDFELIEDHPRLPIQTVRPPSE